MLRDVIDIIDFLDNSSNSADASVAMHLEWNGEWVVSASVSLGPVSPSPIRAGAVESAIVADELTDEAIRTVAEKTTQGRDSAFRQFAQM